MTIENFIEILQKRSRDTCYDDYMYCLIDKLDSYIEDYIVAERTCFIFLSDKFVYTTPRQLVSELKKYNHQRDWIVIFVYKSDIYEYYTSYKIYNNLVLELY